MLWVQDVLGLGLCNGISREPIQGQALGELPAALRLTSSGRQFTLSMSALGAADSLELRVLDISQT